MKKADIRHQIQSRLLSLSPAQRRSESEGLNRRLLADTLLCSARAVGVYLALPDEVDLTGFIENRLEAGIHLAVPVLDADGGWGFHELASLAALRPDAFGIPVPAASAPVSADALDGVIVPGRAFTTDGHRIGRGKGIYDRLLEGCPGHTLGIGFSCQLMPGLPVEPHDIQLDRVWFGSPA